MNHPDQEDLVTLALGEPTDATVSTHLSRCAPCSREVERLHDVVTATSRIGTEQIVLERPPDHVWTAILAETREPPAAMAAVPPAARGRRRRLLTGSLVGFAVGVAATVVVTLVLDRDDAPQPAPDASRTIAQGVVRPFQAAGTTRGSVTVVQDHDRRSIRVRLDRTPQSSPDFVQAWLLDPRNNHMIALGVMGDRTETFPLPEGVDLAAYSSVDISLEPFDGDPQHSATSLARGALTPR